MNIINNLILWFKDKFSKKPNEIPDQERFIFPASILKEQDYKCYKCSKDISKEAIRYFCKYCEHWHCEKHRMPEKHKCPHPTKPKDFTSGVMRYSKHGTDYKTE